MVIHFFDDVFRFHGWVVRMDEMLRGRVTYMSRPGSTSSRMTLFINRAHDRLNQGPHPVRRPVSLPVKTYLSSPSQAHIKRY